MAKHKTIVMVGAFPPPVHGMAAVNAAVRDCFVEVGVTPRVFDVAAKSLGRSLISRIGRLPRVFGCLFRLIFSRCLRDGTLYMSVSGGYGQIYEVIVLVLAKLRGMRLFLHHHSFAYLDNSRWPTRVLMKISGSTSIHITQSTGMAARLRGCYSSVCRVVPISNVVFCIDGCSSEYIHRSELRTIGFISNISKEKGVFEFLDLVEDCKKEGLSLHAKLAGPFQDAETERLVLQRVDALGNVEYVGPQYGEEKEDFFSSIDALIFPTLYDNETEGIVNHEAMCRGIPVIAYGRGCVSEIVGNECGLVIDPAVGFVSPALAQLNQWLNDPEVYRFASVSSHKRFLHARKENVNRWKDLMSDMLSGATDFKGNIVTMGNQSSQI